MRGVGMRGMDVQGCGCAGVWVCRGVDVQGCGCAGWGMRVVCKISDVWRSENVEEASVRRMWVWRGVGGSVEG